VGAAVARSRVTRAQVWITTKVAREHLHPAHVRRTVEDSLRRLGTDHVDLLLVHWPSDAVPLEQTLQAMQELRAAGKARFIGVSNFPSRMLREALLVAPEILTDQVELHPLLAQYELRDAAKRLGVTLSAYSPLARGQALDVKMLVDIAEEHGRTSAQVMLRWLIQLGIVAIPKAASPEHRRENLDIFDFELSEAEMQRIGELDRASRFIDPIWAPQWD